MSSNTEQLSEETPMPEVQPVGVSLTFLNQRRVTALAEIDKASFSYFHVKLCLVAGIGFFADAYDIFAISIAVEMLSLVPGYGTLKPWTKALLKMATPIGNLIGQLLFGWLSDHLGRKRMYGFELMIMIISTLAQAVSGEGPRIRIVGVLIFWRIIMGIGVGGDYPLSAIITSEFAPTRIRGRLMTAVFAFQGWGQLAASLVGLGVIAAYQKAIFAASVNVDYTWRFLIGLGCVPAVFVLYFRLTISETPRFTLDIDRKLLRAEHAVSNALEGTRYYLIYNDDEFDEPRFIAPRASWRNFITHFSKWENFKVLFGAAYSWFALDISFYMLTLDLWPMLGRLVNENSLENDTSNGGLYESLYYLCESNVILTVASLIPGFFAAFLLIDMWGRKPIQLMGFTILTILFLIMSFDYFNLIDGTTGTAKPAFMVLYFLANFFQNFGPNTTTFIVPGEVFPTRYRSTAHGICAACGKLGAIISQILFAAVQSNNETGVAIFQENVTSRALPITLTVLSFFMLSGVFSTLLIPETKQRTLEDLSNEKQKGFITGTPVPVPQA